MKPRKDCKPLEIETVIDILWSISGGQSEKKWYFKTYGKDMLTTFIKQEARKLKTEQEKEV